MKYGSKGSRGLKKYLANLTEFLENPRGPLCQCALPWANPWGLNEMNNPRGISLLHTLPYARVKKWNDCDSRKPAVVRITILVRCVMPSDEVK